MRSLVVITGLSGSGKSLAAKCFEDMGFFCVDNLPVSLILPFHELIERGGSQITHAALVIDARERGFLHQFPEIFQGLRDKQLPAQLIFLDCSDEVLQRRFSETRRPHPMAEPGATLARAIDAERSALSPLREMADRIVDTSKYSPHELRGLLRTAYGISARDDELNLQVLSFGFKYGVPAEADLVFDVRFLPNPYFVEELRRLDGTMTEVQRFLDSSEASRKFMGRLQEFLIFLLPLYREEGKTYLTVAIGCTGGKHRSVALSERLGAFFEERGMACTVNHRDLGKE